MSGATARSDDADVTMILGTPEIGEYFAGGSNRVLPRRDHEYAICGSLKDWEMVDFFFPYGARDVPD